jgi:tRNA U34 5-carboxymethylaminomethyl modifying GTPase MnmE/TrmE
LRGASVALFVYDASCGDDAKVLLDSFIEPSLDVLPMTASVVVVANKSDLLTTEEERAAAQARLDSLVEQVQDVFSSNSGAVEGYMVSAKTNDGMPALKEKLLRHGFDSAVEAAKTGGYAYPGLSAHGAAASTGSGGAKAAARIELDDAPAAKPGGIFALPCFR